MQDDLDTIEYLKEKAGPLQSDYWWMLLEREVRRGVPIEDLGGILREGLKGLMVAIAVFNDQQRVDKHADHDQSTHGRRGGGWSVTDPASGDRQYAGTLKHIRRFQQGGGPDPDLVERALEGETLSLEEKDRLLEGFKDVYNVEHTGVGKDGIEITIKSEVGRLAVTSEGTIVLEGPITDANTGYSLGRFEREFSMGYDGPEVEHVWFRINDEGARGTGFGTQFIQQSEGYYISQGMSRITVHAALEDGGYTWARAGFDWDYDSPDYTFGSVPDNLDHYVYVNPSKSTGQLSTWNTAFQDGDFDNIPTPGEIAMAGYTPGAKNWPGREIMAGTHWYGQKALPPPPTPWTPPQQLEFDTM